MRQTVSDSKTCKFHKLLVVTWTAHAGFGYLARKPKFSKLLAAACKIEKESAADSDLAFSGVPLHKFGIVILHHYLAVSGIRVYAAPQFIGYGL